MGRSENLIKKLKTEKKESEIEETLKEFEEEGNKTADQIAETMGQKEDRNSFVPKVDVSPLNLEGCEINEKGEIIRKDKKEHEKEGEER